MKPVIRWVGGKTSLLSEIRAIIDTKNYDRYVEPFIGGGSVFFSLESSSSVISDVNPELINFYRKLRDEPVELYKAVEEHLEIFEKSESDHYYYMRGLDRKVGLNNLSKLFRATRFLFLNKTCFNGLYRVNRKGQFNTPVGQFTKTPSVDLQSMLVASDLLKNTDISCQGFEEVLDRTIDGDLIFLDPPYFSPEGEIFDSYTSSKIDSKVFHRKLAEAAKEAHSRGAHIIVSNSDYGYIRDLYSDFNIKQVQRPGTMNSKSSKRQKVGELLIYS